MAGFTKLFSSIVTSSVWCQSDLVLRVWVAMLASCDARGVVEGSVPGFASLCRISIEELESALDILSSPDPHSRTADYEGRRIEKAPGGWRVLNYVAYREKGQDKSGSRAGYMRGYRKEHDNALHQNVTRNTEAEAEAEAGLTTPLPPASGGTATPRPSPRKSKKPRGQNFDIASLAMSEEAEIQLRRVWAAWPRTGWNFSTKSEAPRRLNFAGTAARFVDVLKFCPVRKADGSHITAEDLAEAAMAWVAKRKREAGSGVPPCVPCIENFFSSVEGKKHHWKEAVLEHFGAGGDA